VCPSRRSNRRFSTGMPLRIRYASRRSAFFNTLNTYTLFAPSIVISERRSKVSASGTTRFEMKLNVSVSFTCSMSSPHRHIRRANYRERKSTSVLAGHAGNLSGKLGNSVQRLTGITVMRGSERGTPPLRKNLYGPETFLLSNTHIRKCPCRQTSASMLH